jgi:hypothetical protein
MDWYMRNAYKIFVGKPENMRHFRRLQLISEDNIKESLHWERKTIFRNRDECRRSKTGSWSLEFLADFLNISATVSFLIGTLHHRSCLLVSQSVTYLVSCLYRLVGWLVECCWQEGTEELEEQNVCLPTSDRKDGCICIPTMSLSQGPLILDVKPATIISTCSGATRTFLPPATI